MELSCYTALAFGLGLEGVLVRTSVSEKWGCAGWFTVFMR